MKRKIIILVVIVTILLGITILIYRCKNGIDSDVKASVEITVDKKKFQYMYREVMASEWYLYIEDRLTCTFSTFVDYTMDEMERHLENKELIKKVYDDGINVNVYALPLYKYESSYMIIYTLNNKEYYCWNDDIDHVNYESAQKRLEKLYKYVDKDIIKNVSEELWE